MKTLWFSLLNWKNVLLSSKRPPFLQSTQSLTSSLVQPVCRIRAHILEVTMMSFINHRRGQCFVPGKVLRNVVPEVLLSKLAILGLLIIRLNNARISSGASLGMTVLSANSWFSKEDLLPWTPCQINSRRIVSFRIWRGSVQSMIWNNSGRSYRDSARQVRMCSYVFGWCISNYVINFTSIPSPCDALKWLPI